MLADVVLPSRRFQIFTYQVPKPFLAQLHVGTPVMIPLGTAVLSGVVVRIFESEASQGFKGQPYGKTLKPILSLPIDSEEILLDPKLLQLVSNIADYYLAPLSACLRLITPPFSVKVNKRVLLTDNGRSALLERKLSPEFQIILNKLGKTSQGLLRSSLTRSMKNASILLDRLKRKGWVKEQSLLSGDGKYEDKSPKGESRKSRPPDLFDGLSLNGTNGRSSSASPKTHKEISGDPLVRRAFHCRGFEEVSVDGSETLRREWIESLVAHMMTQGRASVLLTPEVQQTESLGTWLRRKYVDQVGVFHGHLSSSIRAARWKGIRHGKTKIIVGTRAALFLPVSNLGLIWVDQEADPSYKEEHLPYYHARDVARMRGTIDQALVVYAGDRPSMEIYERFSDSIKPSLASEKAGISPTELIDMRTLPSDIFLSPRMVERLTMTIESGEQTILLLNRKGFSRALVCRECGQSPCCSSCGVTMKLFHRPVRLVCPYCERTEPPQDVCPFCRGTVFRYSGIGTQRLEEEIAKLFPSVPLARLDRDQAKTAAQASRVLQQFKQKATRILIGTEMLIHQHDLPKAALLGLPQADLGLHIPDFRSAERTFQLLERACGFVKQDGHNPGILLQTRMPEHHVMRAVILGNPQLFYEHEGELRRILGYPPTTHLILVVVTGMQQSRVQAVVNFWENRLTKLNPPQLFDKQNHAIVGFPPVLGPMASQKPRQVKKNRTLFLLKTQNLEETQQQIQKIQLEYKETVPKEPVVVEVNVDPVEIC